MTQLSDNLAEFLSHDWSMELQHLMENGDGRVDVVDGDMEAVDVLYDMAIVAEETLEDMPFQQLRSAIAMPALHKIHRALQSARMIRVTTPTRRDGVDRCVISSSGIVPVMVSLHRTDTFSYAIGFDVTIEALHGWLEDHLAACLA
jgi:hypothetical protein